jgi:hypothetical protein
MIQATELARLLDSLNVGGLFNDADYFPVARGAGAKKAGIRVGDVVADRALADFLFGFANRVGRVSCGNADQKDLLRLS